ncbi:hypothetical protein QC762_0015910 [Podospora pseudocomata]|uniref:Uncharacterized protein n=1 Tax=Podospora pseudocomata TaxID=2093779 RepID=A0ABR0GWW5_9PEZI|nr:hypothetical protein QC762_0015910 [Podospora pseudocomata]
MAYPGHHFASYFSISQRTHARPIRVLIRVSQPFSINRPEYKKTVCFRDNRCRILDMLVDLGGCCIDSGATLLDAFGATLNEIEALAELPKWCWQHGTRLVEVMKRLLNCMSVSSKLVGELCNIRVIHYGFSVTPRRPGIAKF